MDATSTGERRVRFRSARDVFRRNLRLRSRQSERVEQEGPNSESDSDNDVSSEDDGDDESEDDQELDEDEADVPRTIGSGFFTLVPSPLNTALPQPPPAQELASSARTESAARPTGTIRDPSEPPESPAEAAPGRPSPDSPSVTQDPAASLGNEDAATLLSSNIGGESSAATVLPPTQGGQRNVPQATSDEVPIGSETAALPSGPQSNAAEAEEVGQDGGGLSRSADIGIIFGTLAIATLIIAAGVFFYMRRRIKKVNSDHISRLDTSKPLPQTPDTQSATEDPGNSPPNGTSGWAPRSFFETDEKDRRNDASSDQPVEPLVPPLQPVAYVGGYGSPAGNARRSTRLGSAYDRNSRMMHLKKSERALNGATR